MMTHTLKSKQCQTSHCFPPISNLDLNTKHAQLMEHGQTFVRQTSVEENEGKELTSTTSPETLGINFANRAMFNMPIVGTR